MAGEATSTTNNKTQSSRADKTLKNVGNLIKLLPTGTVFLFQFLNPLFTNKGNCHTVNEYLSGALLIVCGISCAFSSFTDSYAGDDGKLHYGVATKNGLCSFLGHDKSSEKDLSKYKLRFGDLVHALLAVFVFAVIALLDSNTVSCFYPSFDVRVVLMALPPVVGGVSGFVFMVFPNTRHGIGHPEAQSTPTKEDAV